MNQSQSTAAPADRRSVAHWPLWRIVVAYTILAALAAASIWLIDSRAIQLDQPVGTAQR
jgi:hypothetical protein